MLQSTSLARRTLLAAMAAGGAALASGLRADERRLGILGQPAPPIAIEHWLDADGAPTAFDPGTLAGRWVYMLCYQHW